MLAIVRRSDAAVNINISSNGIQKQGDYPQYTETVEIGNGRMNFEVTFCDLKNDVIIVSE